MLQNIENVFHNDNLSRANLGHYFFLLLPIEVINLQLSRLNGK